MGAFRFFRSSNLRRLALPFTMPAGRALRRARTLLPGWRWGSVILLVAAYVGGYRELRRREQLSLHWPIGLLEEYLPQRQPGILISRLDLKSYRYIPVAEVVGGGLSTVSPGREDAVSWMLVHLYAPALVIECQFHRNEEVEKGDSMLGQLPEPLSRRSLRVILGIEAGMESPELVDCGGEYARTEDQKIVRLRGSLSPEHWDELVHKLESNPFYSNNGLQKLPLRDHRDLPESGTYQIFWKEGLGERHSEFFELIQETGSDGEEICSVRYQKDYSDF